MNKLVKKQKLTQSANLYEFFAPRTAAKAQPGQFVIIQLDSSGERIPLTVADFDRKNQTITIVVQEAGFTTKKMTKMEEGDSLFAITGPLGIPTAIDGGDSHVVLVGGGLGMATIFPIARALKEKGNRVSVVVGARTKEFLFWQDRFEKVADEICFTTNDGSVGIKGFVTDGLKKFLPNCDRVIAIGPGVMMKGVAAIVPEEIPLTVSLNTIMVDGTGMCGSCRVSVGGETKYACVDGPDFDGHTVNWDELINRGNLFKEEEEHICKVGLE